VEEIRVADDLAYSWTSLTVRITPLAGGDAMERSGSALSIFRKQADGISWLLVRDANLLPAP
jgi:ketosteroid isomerase-like protein